MLNAVPDADDELRALLRRVRQVELRARRAVNAAAQGAWHSRFKGRGMSFSESRAYVAGDDPRHVDWLATARQGDLFVKQFVEERELTLLLAVDLSASMGTGSAAYTRRTVAAEAAAILAFSALLNQDKVGLVAFTDRVERLVRPRKGRGHVLRLVRDILALRPRGERTDLLPALEALSHATHKRAIVAIISDLIGPALPQERLRALGRRHDVVVVEIADALDQALPNVGLVSLVDPESGEATIVDTGDTRVRNAWATRVAQARRQNSLSLDRCHVERVVLQAGDDSAPLDLVRFLRARVRRQG